MAVMQMNRVILLYFLKKILVFSTSFIVCFPQNGMVTIGVFHGVCYVLFNQMPSFNGSASYLFFINSATIVFSTLSANHYCHFNRVLYFRVILCSTFHFILLVI
jgi:hypothetical protein